MKLIAATTLATLLGCTVANPQTVTTQTTTTTRTTTISVAPEGESACLFIGRVFGLDPHGDNFLSVRRRPNGHSGPGYEVDQLFTNDEVCAAQTDGRWLFVRYRRGDSDRVFSGWVFDRYIRAD